MDIQELQPGDVVRISHIRKGLVTVKINSVDESSEFLDANVAEAKVEGLVNTWLEGERLPLRKSLIKKIEKV